MLELKQTLTNQILSIIMILGVSQTSLIPCTIPHNIIQIVANTLLVTNSATAYRSVRSYLIVGKYLNTLTGSV